MIIGAGAAGLAAADVLARAGRSVMILEARDRIGGRCWTRHLPGLEIPVELGAEFIHGEAEATYALLHRARIPAVMANREQRSLQHGRLASIDSFAQAQRAVQGANLQRDISFEEFLAERPVDKKTKTFARMMVEGFDAADPKRVSARSIIEEWGSLGAQPRPKGGYGALLGWLAASLIRRGVRLQTGAPVSAIRRARGGVELQAHVLGERLVFKARSAIVTLPLGVLQHGPLRFPEKRAALAKLASGPVIRIAMRFTRAFWERRAPGVGFFHSPAAPFPTFWTPLPMRAPLLTAWAGGPKAARLAGASDARLIASALASVRSIFREAERPDAVHVQDWQSDRWSRGGYSYVLVGGQGAREELAAPIDRKIFFAGEATDSEEAGTVAGALRSGMRAAREAT
ncbi:MAG TPA: NAD(P)/FAD-dependent oxidoreductase [Burkholderiales bacterium]|nr:NAD(P)/FAD-dependent oxidoreductase [Burkholderiales bacterium]